MNDLRPAALHLLLEDYGKSVSERASQGPPADLPPSELPLWLEAHSFEDRIRWQIAHAPRMSLRPGGPLRELLAERFDPVARYRSTAGSGVWPPDPVTPLEIGVDWDSESLRFPPALTRSASALVHAVLLLLLLIPAEMELDLREPADWNAMHITLMAPPLDDLPPLQASLDIPGEGDSGFLGLPLPAPEEGPGPEPDPEPESEPEPEPEEPEVQPIEPEEEPDPEDEGAAIDETEAEPEPEPEPTPAQSPNPAEFRTGTQLATARDPRLLPMPKAPSRKRAVLQLENPRASMPGRTGNAQAGTLELVPRPDQIVSGAVASLKRGGGPRQAVGDGFGGSTASVGLPPGPTDAGSLVELLSDPRGVDFRPYLTQVLATVRRNWFAVIPESARLGMTRGRTLIQFSVARNGAVPKLVIARTSGTPPLDRAAVAGVSASNPFPPLPQEYLGGEIRLQFTFLYNMRNP